MNLIVFVYLAMFVPFVAIVGARVLFSLYALELGASAFEVGLLATAMQIVPLLLSYAAGLLQDRFGSRWLLALGALAGGLGALLPYFFHSMPALYAASTLFGVWALLILVLTQALVGMLSPPAELARNFSHYTTLAWGTQLFGPLIAGYAIDLVGHARACLALLPFALLAVTMLVIWGGRLPGGALRTGPPLNLRSVFGNREILRVLAISSAVQLAMELFPFFLPLFGHALGLPASTIGWLMVAAALAGIVLCLLLPRLAARHDEERLLGWSFALSALAFALMPVFHDPTLLAVVCVLFGIGMGAGQPLSAMLMFKRSPTGQPGAGMGLRMMTNSATRVAGPPVLGLLAAGFGLASAPLATAAVLAASAWLLARGGDAGKTAAPLP